MTPFVVQAEAPVPKKSVSSVKRHNSKPSGGKGYCDCRRARVLDLLIRHIDAPYLQLLVFAPLNRLSWPPSVPKHLTL